MAAIGFAWNKFSISFEKTGRMQKTKNTPKLKWCDVFFILNFWTMLDVLIFVVTKLSKSKGTVYSDEVSTMVQT